MKILITSGGTKVKIDGVRHIGNMSSGTFGAKIALEALKAGHRVIFFHAKGSKHPLLPTFDMVPHEEDFMKVCGEYSQLLEKYKYEIESITYDDFYGYQTGVEAITKREKPDAIVLAAAVSDYGVVNPVEGKIRSKESEMTIQLKVLPKIISSVRSWAPESFIVGFKLLVGSVDSELTMRALESLKGNNLNLVVANDLRDIKNGEHKLILVDHHVECEYRSTDDADKNYLARIVIKKIEENV